MKTTKKLTLAAAIFSIVAVPVLAGCSSDTTNEGAPDPATCEPQFGEFSTVSDGVLTISTYDGMPYYGVSDGAEEGIDADFLNWFAEESCLTPEWVVSPSASVIQAVASNRTDIAAGGWYATPERGEITSLSAPTYVERPAIFGADETTEASALEGKKVGTVTGYVWVEELKAIAGDLSEYQSSDAALSDLAQGRIDYAVLGSIDAPYLVSINDQFSDIVPAMMAPTPAVESSQTPQLPNYPHTKGNEDLTTSLNAAIAEARESGRWAEIVETYGLDAAIVDLSEFTE